MLNDYSFRQMLSADYLRVKCMRSGLVIFSPVREIGKEFHPHPNPLPVREGEGIGIISQAFSQGIICC